MDAPSSARIDCLGVSESSISMGEDSLRYAFFASLLTIGGLSSTFDELPGSPIKCQIVMAASARIAMAPPVQIHLGLCRNEDASIPKKFPLPVPFLKYQLHPKWPFAVGNRLPPTCNFAMSPNNGSSFKYQTLDLTEKWH